MKTEKRQYETDSMGHEWLKDEDGEVDIFAYTEGEYHNGPQCIRCGYGFCHHCESKPDHVCRSS